MDTPFGGHPNVHRIMWGLISRFYTNDLSHSVCLKYFLKEPYKKLAQPMLFAQFSNMKVSKEWIKHLPISNWTDTFAGFLKKVSK